ncbi:MAG: DUF4062 domain-containing protein [Caldilinea sp. CFX5]|nr:DUF4062 domain-containing protein [Caldilinea sp. CFX5]
MTTVSTPSLIRTPDQRLRVFVSSTLQELADERAAVRTAITDLHLAPVMFELGARPHPARMLYRAYLAQSHLFIGIYWQKYGWVAPGEEISGLEDEYRLAAAHPKLIYIKSPAPAREPPLTTLIERIKRDDALSYKYFSTPAELRELVENDLALLLSERFEQVQAAAATPAEADALPTTNLPVPRSSLIDREWEVNTARDLLLREDVAMLTLTGAGGIGKSRLALHLALDLQEHFPDGAFLVALTPLTDSAQVIPTIAQTLGLRESNGGALADSLQAYLHDKRMLLVLDNFEHLMAAGPSVGALLEACPALKVIVTSRAPLHIRAERELPVPPLALPTAGDRRSQRSVAEQIAQSAAVQLFVQRAQSVKHDFALTDENATDVAEICRQLDGLPLAIEMAAVRIKLLSPKALLARLTGAFATRLDLLRGGTRDLPTRQQTLRNTIAWSYDLLDAQAQRLFRRLAVFAGGWTLTAATAINGEAQCTEVEMLDALALLVDNNLIRQKNGDDGEPRFTMLSTIDDYASELLAISGEMETVRERHALFFLQMAETAEPNWTGNGRKRWVTQLALEHDNLLAALAWSQESAVSPALGLRLAGALGWYWFFCGHLSIGRVWLNSAIARGITVTPRPAELAYLLAKAHTFAGMLAHTQGDYPVARTQLETAMALSRPLPQSESHMLAYALTALSLVENDLSNYDAARTLSQESLEFARRVNNQWLEGLTLISLGYSLLNLRELTAARTACEESLAIFRALADPWGLAMAHAAAGNVHLIQGNNADAQANFAEAVRLTRQEGDHWGMGLTLGSLGYALLRQGDQQGAQAVFAEALAIWQRFNYRVGFSLVLAGHATLAATQGNFTTAARLLGATAALTSASGFALYVAYQHEYERTLAVTRAQLGEAAFATAFQAGSEMPLEQALALVQDEQPPAR